MSDSKESMEKVIGQLQNTVTELKGEECTLLGNLYKCQQSITKENKQNLEIVARKIRAKCLSALSKTDVLKNDFHELYNENKKLQEKIYELEKKTVQIGEIASLKQVNNMKEKERTAMKEEVCQMKCQLQQTQLELQSSQDVISDMISSSFLGQSDEDISNVHPYKKMKTSSENNSPSVKNNEKKTLTMIVDSCLMKMIRCKNLPLIYSNKQISYV